MHQEMCQGFHNLMAKKTPKKITNYCLKMHFFSLFFLGGGAFPPHLRVGPRRRASQGVGDVLLGAPQHAVVRVVHARVLRGADPVAPVQQQGDHPVVVRGRDKSGREEERPTFKKQIKVSYVQLCQTFS